MKSKSLPASAAAEPLLVRYSKASDPKSVENVIVRPGDTVQVKRGGRHLCVLGAVNRPGGYVMEEEGTPRREAISLAERDSVISAATKTIFILRKMLMALK